MKYIFLTLIAFSINLSAQSLPYDTGIMNIQENDEFLYSQMRKLRDGTKFVLNSSTQPGFTQIYTTSITVSGQIKSPNGYFELNRSSAMGFWYDVPFSSDSWGGGGSMTMIVYSTNILTNAYMQIGNTYCFTIETSGIHVGGAASATLIYTLPFSPTSQQTGFAQLNDNGTFSAGVWTTPGGNTQLRFRKIGGANFSLSDSNSSMHSSGCIRMP